MPKMPKLPIPRDKRGKRGEKPARAEQGAHYLAELKRQGTLLFRGLVGLGPKAFDLLRTAEDQFTPKRPPQEEPKREESSRETTVLDLLLRLSEAVGTDSGYARILRGASLVFAQKGFENARIEDILAASKVSPRTYYQFFRNKNEVLDALYDLFISVWVDVAEAELETVDTPEKKLERLARTYVGAVAVMGPLVRVLLSESMRPHTGTAERREQVQQRLVALTTPVYSKLWSKEADPARVRIRLAAVDAVLFELHVNARSPAAELFGAGAAIYETLTAPLLPIG